MLSVFNYSNYPITPRGLNHKKNKSITELSAQTLILSGKKDTLTIPLPRSFENLFVSKKKKVTGFVLHKHIYDLNLSYSIAGLNTVQYSQIIPYQSKEDTPEDIFRTAAFINNHKSIVINKEKGVISFKSDSIVISQPLVIPSGFVFELKAGLTLNIIDGGKIISHSPLNFIGTKLKPIKIISSDKKGQGILVLSEDILSYLKHVEFNDLSNPKHGNWSVTGAVTFYESPVKLEYVTIKDNRCEDALNIVRTTFLMANCNIFNTQSDAFDGDFVTGIIKDSKFINLGNDAIDVSGSDLEIVNVQIIKAGDKGLSAGEDSKMTVNNVSISTSEIAVAGKDLSIINARNLKIENTKLAFTAFQKKPEFGPSNITIDGVIMTNVELNYLVESTSSLLIDGKKVESSQNVKERMYGAEFGVSSAETRNKEYKN